MSAAPYYIATYSGFIVIEEYETPDGWRTKCFTCTDPRSATTFDTFDEADRKAKWAVGHLYPPDLRYFALFAVARE